MSYVFTRLEKVDCCFKVIHLLLLIFLPSYSRRTGFNNQLVFCFTCSRRKWALEEVIFPHFVDCKADELRALEKLRKSFLFIQAFEKLKVLHSENIKFLGALNFRVVSLPLCGCNNFSLVLALLWRISKTQKFFLFLLHNPHNLQLFRIRPAPVLVSISAFRTNLRQSPFSSRRESFSRF